MKKPIPRFTALLPVMLSDQEKHLKVNKAVWDTLPPDQREEYLDWVGKQMEKRHTVYRRIIKIPPYPNPAVTWLLAKLKRQRLTVYQVERSVHGIAFVEITTINPFS